MSRQARLDISSALHHIMVRGNNKSNRATIVATRKVGRSDRTRTLFAKPDAVHVAGHGEMNRVLIISDIGLNILDIFKILQAYERVQLRVEAPRAAA